MTQPPPPESPPPANKAPNLIALAGGIATILTLAVAGTQLIINGIQINEKLQTPVVGPREDPEVLPSGTTRVRPPEDEALPGDPPATPPLDSSVGLMGRDTAPVDSQVVPLSQFIDYPLRAGVSLPVAVGRPMHQLFVAMEKGIKNAQDYTYLIYFLDTENLRQLKKPTKAGTSIILTVASVAEGQPGPMIRLTEELWDRLQATPGQQAVLIACVCTEGSECQPPTIAWEMMRKALGNSRTTITSVPWDGESPDKPRTITRLDGPPALTPGPLIFALLASEGDGSS